MSAIHPTRSRQNRTGICLLLSFLMLATPASAFISSWNGPITVSGQSQTIPDAWQVPGNSTVLDAWLHVTEDGMPSIGNGTFIHARDAPGNMSTGSFSGSTITHFNDALSLLPNGSFSNIDHFTGSSYQMPSGWNQTGGVWAMDGLTQINGTVSNGHRILPHGNIPPSPHGGGIVAATAAGTGLTAGTNAILTSPSLPLPFPINNFSFSFWHWYHLDTPNNSNGDADGAWLEVRLDNGTWMWIEPMGGYGNTIDPSVSTPQGAPTNGSHGFPVFASTNASGWQFANYSMDNVSGINNASQIQFRFRVMTTSNATARPGWFIDDIEYFNEGNSTGVWHHGCYNPGFTCGYSNNAEAVLEFATVDLSNATGNVTVSFIADWDIEGGPFDNWWLEASKDNSTWVDVTTPNTQYVTGGFSTPNGIPTDGVIIGSTTYGDDTGGWVPMNLDLPANFSGDATTWLRFRVETDLSVTSGYPADELEGLVIDNLRVHTANTTIFHQDDFSVQTTAWHSALNSSADDWAHRNLGMGALQGQYGFEDAPAFPPGGWQVQNAGNTGWEFGTSLQSGPTSWPSTPAGFGTVLSSSYPSSAWDHLISPNYTIPAGASARLTFEHWICAESSWDGGAVFISVNNGTWQHFDHTYANGSSWYDGMITSNTASPLHNLGSFDGSSRIPATQFSCNGWNGIPWVNEVADLSNYSGTDLRFRFSFSSDSAVQYDGWFLDDIGLEVDYFDSSGQWSSQLIPADEHGYGWLDADIISPNGTWVTATILDGLSQPLEGWVNSTLPVDLSGLDLDSLNGGIQVQMNMGTDDPYLSPLIQEISIGANRILNPLGVNQTGWVGAQSFSVNASGVLVNDIGVTQPLNTPFIGSGVPIDGVTVSGSFQGVTISLVDSAGNQHGAIGNPGSINLQEVSAGYGVSINVQPNGWIESLLVSGNLVAPALNGAIDVTSNGSVDWSFAADPSYGALGWQDRIAGPSLSHTTPTHSESLTIASANGTSVGTQSLNLTNTVQWSGNHSYDTIHLLCGIVSCGQIVATGSLRITANTIIVEGGSSISANYLATGGTGAGTSVTAASNGVGNGAGGAGHGAAGGNGGQASSNGGSAYGNANESGSEGGDSTDPSGTIAAGGRGGGQIALFASTIIINGTVSADGEVGTKGSVPAGGSGAGGHGAGGGSGGSILLNANQVTINQGGTISAIGGDGGDGEDGQCAVGSMCLLLYNGGNGGGGGAGGRVLLATSAGGLTNTGTTSLAGGSGGAGGQPYGTGTAGSAGQAGGTGSSQSAPLGVGAGSGGSSLVSTSIILPADAVVSHGFITVLPEDPSSMSLDIEVAGQSQVSLAAGWVGPYSIWLDQNAISSIHNLLPSHQDSYGRDWVEVVINATGPSQNFSLTAVRISYGLFENVTGLSQQVKDYHATNSNNGLQPSVDIPLSWSADRGGARLDGGVYHELMITNEPFTVPSTFHPTGELQGFTSGYHHLIDNTLITNIMLTGTTSSGDTIVCEVNDLQNGGNFTQSTGGTMLYLDTTASTVVDNAGSIIVDWQFSVPWSWDDESQVDWLSQAYNISGDGLSPAQAMSGGSGSQASENDLEIDQFQIRDLMGRSMSNTWDPDYPMFAESSTLVNVSGSVRFQNTADLRPQSTDYVVSVNVSGVETVINSTTDGGWQGWVTLPAGAGIASVTSSIIRVGPIVGAVLAEDATTPQIPFEIKLDDQAPSVISLEIDTPQGLKPADGFTWDPSELMTLQLTVFDAQALGDEVTLHLWAEGMNDANQDGIPDVDEYGTFTAELPEGTVGQRQVAFPAFDVSANINNGNLSIFISGTDYVGLPYADGGGAGYTSDYATIVTAINTPTTLPVLNLSLDLADENLLAGHLHTLSFILNDENGIHTLDNVAIHLRGEESHSEGLIEINPRDGSVSTPQNSFLSIDSLLITELGDGNARFDLTFSAAWNAPATWNAGWSIPAIMIYDDDLQTPTLAMTNLAQIRWNLDRHLAFAFDEVLDLTPPLSSEVDGILYVAPGDALMIHGHLQYSNSGAPVLNLPEGMSAEVRLMYDVQEVSSTEDFDSNGTLSVGIVLLSRELTNPILTISAELFGLPPTVEDRTESTVTVVVDSSAPTVGFEAMASSIDSLALDDIPITANVDDDGGIPEDGLLLKWEYRRAGALLLGTEGEAMLSLTYHQNSRWTFQQQVNASTNDDLQRGDVLRIWVEGHDNAGNDMTGTGSELDPIQLEIIIREFILTVPSIQIGLADGSVPSGNQIYTGTEISFLVVLRNAGNLGGVVNVTFVELIDDGTIWVEHDSQEVSIPESATRMLEAFLFETHTKGDQRIYLNITGDIDGFSILPSTPGCALIGEMVQCDLGEEGDMPKVLSSEERDDGEISLWVILLVLLIIALISAVAIVLLRGDGDDPYGYDEEWEDQTDDVSASLNPKEAPALPDNPKDAPLTNQTAHTPDLQPVVHAEQAPVPKSPPAFVPVVESETSTETVSETSTSPAPEGKEGEDGWIQDEEGRWWKRNDEGYLWGLNSAGEWFAADDQSSRPE